MKVIDLLNKIANGEEVPKKIKWCGVIFDYFEGESYEDYINDACCSLFEHLGDENEIYKVTNMLNDEVEIIEDKKIEKLSFGDVSGTPKRATENDIIEKINEIIEVINGRD